MYEKGPKPIYKKSTKVMAPKDLNDNERLNKKLKKKYLRFIFYKRGPTHEHVSKYYILIFMSANAF